MASYFRPPPCFSNRKQQRNSYLRRTNRLSLLLLGIHGVTIAIEDVFFYLLSTTDRHLDQWFLQSLTNLETSRILTRQASTKFTATVTQFIDTELLNQTAAGIGLCFEVALLVSLWRFAWRDPIHVLTPSCNPPHGKLTQGSLEVWSITATVCFLCLNAFLIVTSICHSVLFRALDGFGINIHWAIGLSSTAGLLFGAIIIGHIAPALFRSTLSMAQIRAMPSAPENVSQTQKASRGVRKLKQHLKYHFPSVQGRLVAMLILPISLTAFTENLTKTLPFLGGL